MYFHDNCHPFQAYVNYQHIHEHLYIYICIYVCIYIYIYIYILDLDTKLLGYHKTDQTFIGICIELITSLNTFDSTNC